MTKRIELLRLGCTVFDVQWTPVATSRIASRGSISGRSWGLPYSTHGWASSYKTGFCRVWRSWAHHSWCSYREYQAHHYTTLARTTAWLAQLSSDRIPHWRSLVLRLLDCCNDRDEAKCWQLRVTAGGAGWPRTRAWRAAATRRMSALPTRRDHQLLSVRHQCSQFHSEGRPTSSLVDFNFYKTIKLDDWFWWSIFRPANRTKCVLFPEYIRTLIGWLFRQELWSSTLCGEQIIKLVRGGLVLFWTGKMNRMDKLGEGAAGDLPQNSKSGSKVVQFWGRSSFKKLGGACVVCSRMVYLYYSNYSLGIQLLTLNNLGGTWRRIC